jgi:hypothetical protein
VNENELVEKAAAAHEATSTAVHRQQGSRAAEIESGLIRYLAAEAYHEHVQETRENEDDEPSR